MSLEEQILDVDPAEEDEPEGDDQLSSYTASVAPSVTNFPMENGRRYHAFCEGRYLLPNDGKECQRQELLHHIVEKTTGGKLYLAPIGDHPTRVLDLCTGTGLWVMEFAELFPFTEVLGNDLSPVQPSFVPPNVNFVVDDVEASWVYENSFDFIRARSLELSIKDMPKLLHQAYSALKPGGWFEYQGWDTSIHSADGSTDGTSINQFSKIVLNCFETAGYYTRFELGKMEQWFADAGFINFHVQRYLVPLGTWPKQKNYKEIGTYNLLQAEEGIEAVAMAIMTRVAKWEPEEVQVMVTNARMDMRNPRIHPIFDFYICFGQRPE